jgi:hypothetical protein
MSSLALGLLIILVVATGVFYVAGMQVGHGMPWAIDLCSNVRSLCDHFEWTAIAAGVTAAIYLLLRITGF